MLSCAVSRQHRESDGLSGEVDQHPGFRQLLAEAALVVLGDQRAGTHDPQAWQQSFVAEGTILGVARLRVFPWPIVDTHVRG